MSQSSFIEHGVTQSLWENIIRPTCLKKAGYKCSKCPATEGLDVHHTDYDNQTIDTLIVLCRRCHRKEHGADIEW